jgi:hypothetical protein
MNSWRDGRPCLWIEESADIVLLPICFGLPMLLGLRQIGIHRLLAALLACLLPSCATDVANRYYGAAKFPPKAVDEVEMLDHAPGRPYEVIADFQSRGESPQDLRKKAAAIGADAVIVATLGGYYGENEEWAQQKNANATYTRIVGTAIKYR